jgi:hypothetical protein
MEYNKEIKGHTDLLNYLENLYLEIENIQILIDVINKNNIINFYKIMQLRLKINEIRTIAKKSGNQAADILLYI